MRPDEEAGLFVQTVKLRKKRKASSVGAVAVPARDMGSMTVQLIEPVSAEPVGGDAGLDGEGEVAVPEPPVAFDEDPAASIRTSIEVESRPPELSIAEEIKVYQGSLYLWCILWLAIIMGATQMVKRVGRYPLHEKRPPFRMPGLGWEVGGWSRQGWEWFVKTQPFIWCWLVTPLFGPTALEAMGYEFTPLQSLMFAPIAAVASLGVWAVLPRPLKRWLNGIKPDESSDLRALADLMRDIEDPGIAQSLRSITEEHSSAVEDDEASDG